MVLMLAKKRNNYENTFDAMLNILSQVSNPVNGNLMSCI